MGVTAKWCPAHDNKPHVAAQESLDLFEHQLVTDGCVAASLVPGQLVIQAELEHLLERGAAFLDRVGDVLVYPE